MNRYLRLPALDASLCGKTAVGFDDLIGGHAGTPFKCVYVLREACVQKGFR